MHCKVIGTSSKGNCYVIYDDFGKILILDAGFSYREIMDKIGYERQKDIVAVLCTHEHKDHSASVRDFLDNGITVVMSMGTHDAIFPKVGYHYASIVVKNGEKVFIGSWEILAFDVQHDAAEPLGFVVRHRITKQVILYLTDSYYSRYAFKGLTHMFVECNFVDSILEENARQYPEFDARYARLKKSHMSLDRLKKYVIACDLSKCLKIVLVHLSDRNSNETEMKASIETVSGIETIVADTGIDIDMNLVKKTVEV